MWFFDQKDYWQVSAIIFSVIAKTIGHWTLSIQSGSKIHYQNIYSNDICYLFIGSRLSLILIHVILLFFFFEAYVGLF